MGTIYCTYLLRPVIEQQAPDSALYSVQQRDQRGSKRPCSGRSCRCLDLPVEGAVGVAGGLDEGLAQEQREPGVAAAGEPFPEALRHDVLPPARPLLPVKPRTRRKFTPT